MAENRSTMEINENLDGFEQSGHPQRSTDATCLEEILHRIDRLPDLDPRSPDEIIDYDERGLPR